MAKKSKEIKEDLNIEVITETNKEKLKEKQNENNWRNK